MVANFQIPPNQKAWIAVRRGTPAQSIHFEEHVSVPSELRKGEVLVKVRVAALNPVDHKLLWQLPNFAYGRPHAMAYDLTGVIVDSKDPNVRQGEEVVGFIPMTLQMKTGQGALCQYTRIPGDHVVPKPTNLKYTEAAGFGTAGLTAYQALFSCAKLEPGQNVFINGGSTSVGLFAIQLAKALGCTVTATASTKKEELLKSLGVDKFIDYTKAPVHVQLEGDPPSPKFHVMFEAVGTTDVELYTHSEAYLVPGGIFVSVGPTAPQDGVLRFIRFVVEIFRPRILGGVDRPWKWVGVGMNNDDFKQLIDYAAKGKVRGVVDSVFAFEDVLKAYERVMSSRTSGKVVVKVDPDVE